MDCDFRAIFLKLIEWFSSRKFPNCRIYSKHAMVTNDNQCRNWVVRVGPSCLPASFPLSSQSPPTVCYILSLVWKIIFKISLCKNYQDLKVMSICIWIEKKCLKILKEWFWTWSSVCESKCLFWTNEKMILEKEFNWESRDWCLSQTG